MAVIGYIDNRFTPMVIHRIGMKYHADNFPTEAFLS